MTTILDRKERGFESSVFRGSEFRKGGYASHCGQIFNENSTPPVNTEHSIGQLE